MPPSQTALFALAVLMSVTALTSANPGPRPAEISMAEFNEMCTYFPGMLHCPGIALEKRSSTDGFLRSLVWYSSSCRQLRGSRDQAKRFYQIWPPLGPFAESSTVLSTLHVLPVYRRYENTVSVIDGHL
ncbi:hypothetical protein AAVH_02333 [Aphelenchoides avenae]|nr:hypothetical protein AAVH_02333 [Aphelenchus avenae]